MWLYSDKVSLRKYLRINEIIRVEPGSDKMTVLIKDVLDRVLTLQPLHTHTPWKCHVRTQQKARQSASQQEGSHQKLAMLDFDLELQASRM